MRRERPRWSCLWHRWKKSNLTFSKMPTASLPTLGRVCRSHCLLWGRKIRGNKKIVSIALSSSLNWCHITFLKGQPQTSSKTVRFLEEQHKQKIIRTRVRQKPWGKWKETIYFQWTDWLTSKGIFTSESAGQGRSIALPMSHPLTHPM